MVPATGLDLGAALDVLVEVLVEHAGDAVVQDHDVDLLVEMDPGRSLLDFVGLWQELEDLLGLKVDLVSEGGISPYLREQILSEAIAL